MSKVIKRLNAYGMGGTFDQPGYEYDPVNDTFKDLETGKVFSKEYVAPTSGTGTGTGTVKLEDNRIKIIDASQYVDPVEVTPSQGKDGMKKVTVTVSNIPVASDIESNKAATIDVSQYTEPVEITPTSGKDGMAKTTVTLSNIPVAGFKAYAWNYVSGEDTGTEYFGLDKAPSSDVQHYNISRFGGNGYSIDYRTFGGTITKVSDTEFTCEYSGDPLYTYTRDTTKDFVIEN